MAHAVGRLLIALGAPKCTCSHPALQPGGLRYPCRLHRHNGPLSVRPEPPIEGERTTRPLSGHRVPAHPHTSYPYRHSGGGRNPGRCIAGFQGGFPARGGPRSPSISLRANGGRGPASERRGPFVRGGLFAGIGFLGSGLRRNDGKKGWNGGGGTPPHPNPLPPGERGNNVDGRAHKNPSSLDGRGLRGG